MDNRHIEETLKITAETALTIAQSCLKIVEQLEHQANDNKYLSPEAAAAALGDISPDMLVERCRDRRFRYGREFINSSDGKRSNYLIKPSAVRKFFETDPAKRPPLRQVV